MYRHIRPITTDGGPKILITAAPELIDLQAPDRSGKVPRAARAVWCTHGRRVGTKWFGSEEPRRLSVPEFWDWLDQHTHKRSAVWVVCDSAGEFLTAASFWSLCDAQRYRFVDCQESGGDNREDKTRVPVVRRRKNNRRRPAKNGGSTGPARPWTGRQVLRGRTDIIKVRGTHGTVTFVGHTNYTSADLRTVGRAVGANDAELLPQDRGEGSGRLAPQVAAKILAVYYRLSIARWIAEGCGPWDATAGNLAVNYWRRKHYTHRVTNHQEPEAVRLEGEACHAPREVVFYFGDVGHPGAVRNPRVPPPEAADWSMPWTMCHRLDITSQHAALMRDELFPVELLGVTSNVRPSNIEDYTKHHCLIAEVEVDSRSGEYPCRVTDGRRFPVGRFWTTLATPELSRLLREDALRSVGRVAVYRREQAFAALMGDIIARRTVCQSGGLDAEVIWWKSLANAFAGKWAQRCYRWVPKPGTESLEEWGPFKRTDPDTGKPQYWRAIAGVPWKEEGGEVNSRLLAAVFAHLTSYGRCQMRALREALPPSTVIAQDTDCLWLTDDGFDFASLSGWITRGIAGQLRHDGSAFYTRFFSARHYYQDGNWTLAGVASRYHLLNPRRVREWQTMNPVRGTPTAAPSILWDIPREYDLNITARIPRVGPDGWAKPDSIPTAEEWINKHHPPPPPPAPPSDLFDGF